MRILALLATCLFGISAPTSAQLSAPRRTTQRPVYLPGFAAARAKLDSGAPLKITYLGGSVTRGGTTAPCQGTGPNGPYDYCGYASSNDSWRAICHRTLDLASAWPGQFNEDNNGLGATGSELAAYRFERDVGFTDILLCEFALNDILLLDPTAADVHGSRSAFRTLKSVVEQARSYNPDVAIVTLISPVRDFPTATGSLVDDFTTSRATALRFSRNEGIPIIDMIEFFYERPIPAGFDASLFFDGGPTTNNSRHPAPEGHRYYAHVVAQELQRWINLPLEVIEPAEPYDEELLPYPVDPQRLSPEELALEPSASDWFVALNQENWLNFPFYENQTALFASESGVELEVPFEGSAVGVWFEWFYNDLPIEAEVEFIVDGESLGVFNRTASSGASKLRRFMPLKSNLDPAVPHLLTIRTLEEPPQDPEFRLAINAVFVGQ